MKTFLNNMFSNKENVSSKRISGVLCLLFFWILLTVAFFTGMEITEIIKDLLKTLFYGGLLLLGVAAVEKAWTK